MKLGEIKIEALKLMFALGNEDVSVSDLDRYMKTDEAYSDYLNNMPGAINRCFALIEERRVLPLKGFTLGDGGRYDLDALIPDFFDIERIVYERGGEYDGNCGYLREGNTIIIKEYDAHGEYRLLYRPRLERITSLTNEEKVLDIPDGIACYIPYFIKGDLFRVDEPDEAAEARNWFEAAMLEISTQDGGRQTRVERKYSFYGV